MTNLLGINLAVAGGASSTTVAWFTLAGALGGVLVTGLVSLVTVTLNHRWQSSDAERQRLEAHSALVRQERRESYSAYWLAWNRFTQELRKLREVLKEVPDGVIVNRRIEGHVLEMPHLKQLGDLIDNVWEKELEWRAAADALLIIADPEVEKAARAHIALTERKLEAAWEGSSHFDQNGATYYALNNAMRDALLTPVRPDAWADPEMKFFGIRVRRAAPRQL